MPMDKDRRLKEMLFEFVKAIEDGDMDVGDAGYAGVTVGTPDGVFTASLNLSFKEVVR